MPAPGDQHKSSLVNPFEEQKPRISEYTAQEIATLQVRLDKQLGPEFISSRPGAGGQKVHYLAAEKCINLANDVFGFNGWSSAIREVQVDFVDENVTTGKISLGLSVVVRITLRDGAFHEDIGYGHIENCKGKAAAFEKAKKEGTTDAMKRALRNFGNVLGNCVYDKDYVAKVTKMKIAPTKFDADNLHRHPEYARIKKESLADVEASRVQVGKAERDFSLALEVDDEFDTADFDEADFSVAAGGHPDEVVTMESAKPPSITNQQSPSKGLQAMAQPNPGGVNPALGMHPTLGGPPNPITQMGTVGSLSNRTPMPVQAPSMRAQQQNSTMQQPGVGGQRSNPFHAQQSPQKPQSAAIQQANSAANGISPAARCQAQASANVPAANASTPPFVENRPPEGDAPVGFFTARVAKTLQNGNKPPPEIAAFNPRLESPSIRKTAGVDHSSSKPIPRDLAGTAAAPASPAMKISFVNPQLDPNRRVGMPGGMASPLQNRNSFRHPQMKRPADGNVQLHGRAALNDVTTTSVNTPLENPHDAKRPRVGSGLAPGSAGNVVPG